jgi:hypothetical protein
LIYREPWTERPQSFKPDRPHMIGYATDPDLSA